MPAAPAALTPPAKDPSRPLRYGAALAATLALLLLGAALHLWYLVDNCPLDLSGDEAHYWEWSRRLDLSYYSKGPLVAYIIAAGRALFAPLSERLCGNELLAVRGPALILSVLSGLGLFVLTLRIARRPWLAFGVVALTASVPVFAAGAMLMTIDSPLICLWVWTLVCLHAALSAGTRADAGATAGLGAWLAAGVLIALGILAKYTMVLIFPAVGLLLLFDPALRRNIARPGPWLATLVGVLGFVPILLWNAQHDWVSFRHVAGQAGLAEHESGLDFSGLVTYVTGQLAVVSPIWYIAMIAAAIALFRRPSDDGANERQTSWETRLLLAAAWIPWLVFLAFSPLTKVQPNWPVLGHPAGMILLAIWLRRLLMTPQHRKAAKTLIVSGAAIGGALVVVMHHTDWLMPLFSRLSADAPPWELTPAAKYDPAARLRGWRELGEAVGDVLVEERAAGRDPILLTDDYQVASEVAFYTPGHPQVYCIQVALGQRYSQYDLWRPNPVADPEQFVGRPVVYIGALTPKLTEPGDDGVTPLPGLRPVRTVEHRVRGELMQVWAISVCDAFGGLSRDRASEHF